MSEERKPIITDEKAQARENLKKLKEKKEKEKQEMLAGIIDRESKTYTFDFTMNLSGEERTGTFTAKYMGVAGRLRLGTIRAKLLDGAPSESIDQVTDDIAFMIAYLQVSLIKKPRWFDFDEIDDVEELKNLYLKVFDFMSNFRKKDGKNTNAGDSEAASGQTAMENS